jgi:hypothetical protein
MSASATAPATGDRRDNSGLTDVLSVYNVGGAVLGVLVGVWAANTSSLRAEEETVLLATAGAAVGLLGIILAAIALMAGFLRGFYGRVIGEIGIRPFFRPFQILAIVSALAALFGFGGALDASPGPEWLRVTLFGLATGFMVAAIVGTVGLVSLFVRYAEVQRKLEDRAMEGEQP